MTGIFITYRSVDPGWSVLLDRELSAAFGADQVFRASRVMRLGESFPDRIRAGIENASVLLPVIGPRWLQADEEGQRRIDDPEDWVRQEILMAFEAGLLVVPVLVDDMRQLTVDQLPAELAPLADRQYIRLGHRDAEEVIPKLIRELIDLVPELAPPPRRVRLRRKVFGDWRWLLGLVTAVTVVIAGVFVTTARRANRDAHYRTDLLRADAGIPNRYRRLIVEAGTTQCGRPEVTPALVAGILKAESNFDPDVSDPAKNEYGIARWTPSVLAQHPPRGVPVTGSQPALSPEIAIPAVGTYLCFLTDRVAGVPGDRDALLASAYATSGSVVRKARGVPADTQPFVDRVLAAVAAYRPVIADTPSPT